MLNLHPAVEQALLGDYKEAHLITMYLNGATLYLTEASRNIRYNGDEWLANGLLMAMSEPQYTSELRVNSTEIAFTAVNQSVVAIFLNNSQYNRSITIDRGYLDSNGEIIGTPIRLNNFNIVDWGVEDDNDGETIITVKVANEFAAWEMPNGRRTTDASQKLYDPTDEGMQYATSVRKELTWGSEN